MVKYICQIPHAPLIAYSSSRRVDFPMVDLAKIMFYPRFWDLAHRFYEESWEYSCNRHYNEILIDEGIGFPLVHSVAEFHHPLSYGDTVNCEISVTNIGNSSISWQYEFRNQHGELCWTAKQVTVCVNMDQIGTKIPVPEWMRDHLSQKMLVE